MLYKIAFFGSSGMDQDGWESVTKPCDLDSILRSLMVGEGAPQVVCWLQLTYFCVLIHISTH